MTNFFKCNLELLCEALVLLGLSGGDDVEEVRHGDVLGHGQVVVVDTLLRLLYLGLLLWVLYHLSHTP